MHTENINSRLKITIVFLIVIVILGTVLRIYGLGYQSLWTDELASWDITKKDNLKSVIKETIKDDQPPGYYIFQYYIQKYFGDSEIVLRIPSVFGGLLCIIAIFILGSRLYSEKEGLFAAALMSFTWCPIYYSQEARSYIFLVLFSILSIHFWLPIIKSLDTDRKPTKGNIVFYVLFASLCCYTHYFGAYLVALQGTTATIYLLTKKKSVKYIFLIYLLIGVTFSPWLQPFLTQLENVTPKATSYEPISISRFVKYVGYIFGAQKSPFVYLKGYTNFDILVSLAIISVTLGLIILLLFLKVYDYFQNSDMKKQSSKFIDSDVILFVWFLLPFFGIYLLGKMSFTVFRYRYLLISLPAAYLLLSRAITKIFPKKSLQLIVCSALLVFFSIHLIYYMNYYSVPIKEQFRDVVNYVIKNDNEYSESTIVGYTYDNFFDYYIKQKGFNKKVYLYVNEKKDMTSILREISIIQTKYVWLLSGHLMPDDKFIEHLSISYKVIQERTFIEAKVWLFEKI
jgi:uncharacterized membrane protein